MCLYFVIQPFRSSPHVNTSWQEVLQSPGESRSVESWKNKAQQAFRWIEHSVSFRFLEFLLSLRSSIQSWKAQMEDWVFFVVFTGRKNRTWPWAAKWHPSLMARWGNTTSMVVQCLKSPYFTRNLAKRVNIKICFPYHKSRIIHINEECIWEKLVSFLHETRACSSQMILIPTTCEEPYTGAAPSIHQCQLGPVNQ